VTRTLRLSAEYFAHPLWERTPGEAPTDVDPASLPLSDELIEGLRSWNEDFQDIAQTKYAFATSHERQQWEARGRALAQSLRDELGDDYCIEYQAR